MDSNGRYARCIRSLGVRVAVLVCAIVLAMPLAGCEAFPFDVFGTVNSAGTAPEWFDPASVPDYDGAPSVEVNGNVPAFEDEDFSRGPFEEYSPLDKLGRCGTAFACIGEETLPTEARGSVGSFRPSGWQLDKYEWVDQKYLYNRCHLIGWQLAAENDNELNLITGTRSMNTQGMLPYENLVARFVYDTGFHVLYRVTPVFEGRNLVASGVLMEAESVEDNGAGVRFCVWCYNVEPGVRIDYATGKSKADGTIESEPSPSTATSAPSSSKESEPAFTIPGDDLRADAADATYILNTSSGKFHLPTCSSVGDIRAYNKFAFNGTREQAIDLGFKPCGACKP